MRQPIGLSLALLPTPLHSLPNLSSSLGVELWTKRDDLTGLAFGGNKTRKLQWIVKDAQQKGATVLITTGAPQSNHCRQTAAAAKVAGMNCVLVLGGNGSRENTGNLLLDHLLGAEIRWLAQSSRSEMMQSVAAERRGEGEIPYVIPLGGSNGLGAASYIEATHELAAQVDKPFDFIVFASSSGGTQTGIAAGV
jgi:D-cysteine desulfhydrase